MTAPLPEKAVPRMDQEELRRRVFARPDFDPIEQAYQNATQRLAQAQQAVNEAKSEVDRLFDEEAEKMWRESEP